ncbi:hypothetical protein [Rhodococcus sp. H29-C3]|uniref:hypothetical protein n=1 Tax=Rhodococcus sp. H29-C3 TaxID=3046307 RepID=UPI0024B95829|nr:hypothetical protein [Rhodococcus sp. H29-C3]MDJ0362299.1 hypothetical protein [Rhodococcus sp. H29-C3]
MTVSDAVRETMTAGALLFDMDGTLVDPQSSIESVWFEFADRHGIDRAVVANALPGRVASDIIERVLGPGADIESEVQWIRLQENRNAQPVEAMSGAARFVASVPADRWAVVTSATRLMMVRRLKGLFDFNRVAQHEV